LTGNCGEPRQAARVGEAFCYVGKQGSRQRCNVSGDKSEIVANVNRLDRREGITMAVGFNSGAFAGYQETLSEKFIKIWSTVQAVVSSLTAVLILLLIWRYRRLFGRYSELKPIPPEYLPPKQASFGISVHMARILEREDARHCGVQNVNQPNMSHLRREIPGQLTNR